MPSKNMLPKGKRRKSVRSQYRATRTAEQERAAVEKEAALEGAQSFDSDLDPHSDLDADLEEDRGPEDSAPQLAPASIPRNLTADASAAGQRLDAYLAHAIPSLSRARVQLLISAGQVQIDGATAKPSHKLRGGETISIEGEPRPAPLRATPEDIPLNILYEDEYLAVIDKPAGMMVHAGAGRTDDPRGDTRSSGTLVNALLHHMQQLSGTGGELRPGIVHRLDKDTSGAIAVAKDDQTHRQLSELFSARRVKKTYIALVHGNLEQDSVTVNLPIARDVIRRTRMTTRRPGAPEARTAVSHIRVLDRLATPYGPFTLVEVRIETGRTHQIRVHMQSLGHPVVGDTLYGAPRTISVLATSQTALSSAKRNRRNPRPIETPLEAGEVQSAQMAVQSAQQAVHLNRNFLHAARLEFTHPRTGKPLLIDAPLPLPLQQFLRQIGGRRLIESSE